MRGLKKRTQGAQAGTVPVLNAVIDLSHHDGPVDLLKARGAGIIGVIHKATQGLSYVDPLYASNQAKAQDAGLLWGAYHFGTGGDGVAQAEQFLTVVDPRPTNLVVLDFEADPQGPSMTLEEARAFVTHIHARLGRWPGLYSGHFVKELLGPQSDPVLGKCWFWLAQYGQTPVVPPTWESWTLWQYTDGGQGLGPHAVDGVGRCDRDKFNGDEAALHRLWGA